MKLTSDLVAGKWIVGNDGEGHPIAVVMTHGGLYAGFKMSMGVVRPIAAAPHKAVLSWLIEQKEPRAQITLPVSKWVVG